MGLENDKTTMRNKSKEKKTKKTMPNYPVIAEKRESFGVDVFWWESATKSAKGTTEQLERSCNA